MEETQRHARTLHHARVATSGRVQLTGTRQSYGGAGQADLGARGSGLAGRGCFASGWSTGHSGGCTDGQWSLSRRSHSRD